MAVYWIPVFYALPVIAENNMMEDDQQNTTHATSLGGKSGHKIRDTTNARVFASTSPSAIDSALGPQRHGFNRSEASPLDMSSVSAALPDHSYARQQQTQYQETYSSNADSSGLYQQYHASQYQTTPGSNFTIPLAQQLPMAGYQNQRVVYSPYPMNMQGGAAFQQSYLGQVVYPGHGSGQSPAQSHVPHYTHSSMFSHASGRPYAMQDSGHYQMLYGYGASALNTSSQHGGSQEIRRSTSETSLRSSTALRGPPRKPRQSGHALWVGNLPPGTNIIDLKDHFARDATDEIESVFLISKSNCAFVNYRSEKSCSAAMNRFHDSRFMGARLVCRLRRGSTPGSANTTTTPPGVNTGTRSSPLDSAQVGGEPSAGLEKEGDAPKTVKERFFIIKCLTVDDLERSVHSGIWATQSHNEVALNKAFKTAESVYLIFSANKSGEYFGYARMDSSIDDSAAAEIELPPISPNAQTEIEISATAGAPLTIPTPASPTAPKGYIIDDSARGTIFWEAETASTEAANANIVTSDPEQGPADVAVSVDSAYKIADSESTTFGKPFKITWVSTERLAFYRTRGLRNPWNSNREVKIARDGTELEPTIGRKLVDMFGMNSGGVQPRGPQQGQFPANFGQGPAYRPY